MLTFEEATTAREFHYNGYDQRMYGTHSKLNCSVSVGPRGGVKITQLIARRNGNTQTWRSKGRWHEYRIPIIHGLKGYGSITHQDSDHWHTNDTCPLVLAEIHIWSEVTDIPSDYSERMRAVESHLEQCADCREGKRQ